MMSGTPNIAQLVGALPPGTIPTAYAPLLQVLQSMVSGDGGDAPLEEQLELLQRRLRVSEQRLERAQRTIRAYRAQNRLLARAHGACDCWGGNPACRHCAGQGMAGWFTPEADLLRDLLGALPTEGLAAHPDGGQNFHAQNPKPETTTQRENGS